MVSAGFRYETMRGDFYQLSENNFELCYKRLRTLQEKIKIENRSHWSISGVAQ